MKTVLFGHAFDTKSLSVEGFRFRAQAILDNCLGNDKVQVEFTVVEKDSIELILHRRYGEWFKPQPGDEEGWIYSWDQGIVTGDMLTPNCEADFETHTAPAYIWHHADDLKESINRINKTIRGSRIKHVEVHTSKDELRVKLSR